VNYTPAHVEKEWMLGAYMYQHHMDDILSKAVKWAQILAVTA